MSEAVVHRCSVIKVLLKISRNSQENTNVGASGMQLNNRLRQMCFPVNFEKSFRTHFLIEHVR